ncbi:retention module-containing protein [Aeromonas sp. FDAARGOS 1415]|nr:retention module-containing protein [Aeromonas sp. FDAARGOS 1415]
MRTQIIDKTVVVSSVEGNVQILLADGSSRPLQPGEILQPGARLNIADGAKLMLAPYDDSQAPANAAPTGPETPADGQPSSSVANQQPGSPEVSPEIAALQQSILQGVDPTKNFEASAAGGAPAAGGGGGGVGGVAGASGNGGFVTIDRIGDATIAEAGFDTGHDALAPQNILQEDQLPLGNQLDDQDEVVATLEEQAISGNLLDNSINLDGPLDTSVVSYSWGNNVDVAPGVETTLEGIGTLIINADGSYTFTPFLNYTGPVPVVSYTVTDGDDTNDSTLTITITPVDEPVILEGLQVTGGELVLDEAALVEGSAPDAADLTKGSTFTFSAADGVQSLTLGGVSLISNGQVITSFPQSIPSPLGNQLVVTGISFNPVTGAGSVSYSYTLLDNEAHAQPADDTALSESFSVVLTDNDGDSTSASLDVVIRDDVPSAKDDAGGSVTEDAAGSLSGSVLGNDFAGADTPAAFVGWSASGHDNTVALTALNTYGTFTQNPDGTWAYALDNTRVATQVLNASSSLSYDVWYTMTDADGDQSIAKLTVNIQGADDSAKVTVAARGADTTVFEAGLNPNGSAAQTNAETDGSTFQVFASDGIKQLVIGGTTFTVAQLQDPAYLAAHPINTGEGTLTLTGYSSADGKTAAITYSYTLDAAQTHTKPDSDITLTDQVLITLEGVGGSTASGTLKIDIIDDRPTPSVAANAGGTAALTVSLDETTGASDYYALGEAADSYVNDDVPGALARVTTALSGGLLGLFTINGSYGADGIGAQSSVMSFQGVPVGGLATNLVATDGGAITLVSSSPTLLNGVDGDGDTVFTIAIVNVGGVLQLQTTLFEALDNGKTSLYDEAVELLLGQGSTLSLQLQVTRTDGDGDTVVASDTVMLANHITSAFSFDDDAPVASNYTGANFAEGSGAHNIGSATTVLGISAGEDGLQGTLQGIVFTNQGTTGGTLAIDGSGNLIYTSPGNVTSGTAVTETFLYTVTDKDGDAITRMVTFGVTDTGISNVSATNELVDEDDIVGGNTGNAGGAGDDVPVTTGHISYTLGADALQGITLSVANTGLTKLDGTTVQTSWNANTNTLTGYGTSLADVVFTIVLKNIGSTGADYDLTLFQPVTHPGHDDPSTSGAVETSFEDNVGFTVAISVKDVDNSEGTTSFTVTIDDDSPVASNYTGANFAEGSGAHNIGSATTVLGISAGEDGLQGTLQGIVFTNQGTTGGTLAIDGSGNLIYTSPGNVTSGTAVTETFLYTVTDKDGDAITRMVTFGVTDTGISNVSATNELVDEDDIVGGNTGNAGGAGDDVPVTTGHISYTLGADALQGITLSVANTGLTKLDGTTVQTSWNANTNTLTGYGTSLADVVFTIVLKNIGSTGADYDLTLFQPVTHPGHDDPSTSGAVETSFEDNVGFTVAVSVKDVDNSEGTTSFTVTIDDDSPVASNYTGANFAEGSGAHNIGSATTVLGISAGEDGLQGTLQGIVFTNQGTTGGTLAIDGSGNLIYTSPGNVTSGTAVTETFLYTVTDKDGDAITRMVTFGVTDTGISNVSATNELVDEDDIVGGNTGNAGGAGDDVPVTTGHISYTLGADALQGITLSVANTGLTKLDGTTVQTSWNANTNTLTGYGTSLADVVFTIVLKNIGSTGADYDLTLFQPVTHPGHDDPSTSGAVETSFEDNVGFTVAVSVKDVDNSEGTTSFTVTIDDDSPVASNYTGANFAEGSGAHNIGSATTVLGISAGEDGLQGTLQGIVFTNQGTTGGTLAIDGSGNLIYTSPGNVTSGTAVTETFLYTVTDKDGDAITRMVTFGVTDTGISNVSATNELVDEDDIVGGNTGNAGGAGDDVPVTTGHISYTLGADALQGITLSVANTGLTKLDGTTVQTSWNANTNTLTGYGTSLADVVFTIVLKNIGSTGADYDLTLFQPVTHPGHDDPSTSGAVETSFEDNVGFTVAISVKDVDNSEGTTSFTVTIDDDSPVASNYTGANFAEGSGAHNIGSATTVLGISAGEDGLQGTLQGIVFTNQGTTGGTLAIDGSGNLIYTSPGNVTSGTAVTETFLYTVTDKDGDAITRMVTFGVTDTGISNVSATNELVDEDDIVGGNTGNAGGAGDDVPVTTGHISYTLGADALQGITLSVANTGLTKLDGTTVQTSWNANTNTLTGYGTSLADVVFTIVLKNIGSTGADYDLTLFQPVTHPGHDDPSTSGAVETSFEDNVGFTVAVSVKDVDNSEGTTSFTVTIDDDSPVASNYTGANFAEGSGAHNIGSATTVLGISAGEDGLQGTLQGIVFTNQGTTGGTLAIDGSGNLIYTSPGNVTSGTAVTETFLYTVTDKDGDAITRMVTFGVTDTGISNVSATNELVDEDDIVGGNTGNAGGAGDDVPVTTGHISYTLGADALQGITLSVANTGLTKLDGTTVQTSWNANTNTLTGYGTSLADVVFTIVLKNIGSTGADYDLTLFQPVTHPGHDDPSTSGAVETSFEDNVGFTVAVSVKDVDNSEGTTSFTVTIDDDSPVASNYTGANFAEGSGAHNIGSATTVLGISAGEDGLQGTLQGIVFTNQGTTGGTLAIDGSGNLIYTSPGNVTSGTAVTETFLYTVTDKDGDAITRMVTFGVTDTGISNVSATNELVDEDDIVGGNTGNAGGAGDDVPVTTGHISYTLGADALQGITLSVANTGLTKLDGTTVQTSWNANTNTLTGYGTSLADVVFTIVLKNIGSTGADYDLTLFQPVTHPGHDDPSTSGAVETSFEDNVGFTVAVSVKDVDNSEGTTSFTVTIDDDSPVASNYTGANFAEGSGAHNIGSATTVLGISAGEDGLQGTLQGIVFTNQGTTGGTLAIDGSGNLIYTSPGNVTSGTAVTETFLYTVTDKDGDAITRMVTFGVTDTGISNVSATNELVDEDDIVGGNTGNAGGAGDDVPVTTGHISYTLGADALQGITLSVANTGLTKLDGTTVQTSWNANTNTLTGYGTSLADVVFTIVLKNIGSTGADYDLTLFQPVTHPGHDDPSTSGAVETSFEDNVGFTVAVGVKDVDNSEGTTSFTVTIDDDSPVASNYTGANFAEGSGAHNIGSATTVLGISAGEDGLQGTLQGIVFTNQGTTGGTLAIDGSGNLIYTSPGNVTSGTAVTETFLYTVTDKDGDAITRMVTFGVTDTGISNVSATNELVDEDDIVGGNTGNAGGAGDDVPVTTGHISYTLGADALQGITLSVANTGLTKLDGTTVQTSWNANTNTLTGYGTSLADVVFTIVLKNIGSTGADYDLTLFQPVTHPGHDDPSTSGAVETSFEDNVGFTVAVSVKDVDNSEGTTSFTVTIDDDSPVASNYTGANFAEGSGAHNIGSATTVLGISAGEDGLQGTLQGIVFTNQGTTGGTLAIDGSGNLIYTSPGNVTSGTAVTETFLYTVTDKDGDAITRMVTFGVTDTGISNVSATNELVDEDDIVGGNTGNAGGAGDDVPVTTGHISYTLGADALQGITLSVANTGLTKLDGTTVQTSWNANTNTLTGYGTSLADVVFTIVLKNIGSTGADYDLTLFQPVTHPGHDDPSTSGAVETSFEDNVGFTVAVSVKDVDNSEGTTSFTVSLDDDTPITTGSAHHGYVANSVNTSATGDLAISFGADGFGSYSFDTPFPNVTSGGRTVEYVQTGNVLTGYVDANNNDTVENGEQAFRLQLNTNGTYTFTLLKQLDAPETVGIGGSSSFGSGPAQGQLLTNTGGTLQLAVLQGWMTNNSWTSADFNNWQAQGVLNAAHVDQASVNGSTAGWGVDNNNFNSSEILRMDFNNYSSFDGATLPSAFDGPAVNYATIQLVGFAQTEKVAYVIHYEDNTFEAGNGTVATLAGTDLTMTLGSGKYIDYIELLDVESGGGGKFQLVNLSTVTNTGTLNMEFGIKATDGDGDTTSQVIAVTVDGSNPIDGSTANDSLAGDAGSNTINALAGNDILDGSFGSDILNGGDGNDVLIGGFGNDTLTGGSGRDTFKWQSGESGGPDIIKDFTTGSNGDVLDLSELLSGEHANATSLDQYLNFASGPGANKSTLTIDLDGSAGGTATHTIFFDNVDLTVNSTRSDQQIIQDLLNQGNLKVDP